MNHNSNNSNHDGIGIGITRSQHSSASSRTQKSSRTVLRTSAGRNKNVSQSLVAVPTSSSSSPSAVDTTTPLSSSSMRASTSATSLTSSTPTTSTNNMINKSMSNSRFTSTNAASQNPTGIPTLTTSTSTPSGLHRHHLPSYHNQNQHGHDRMSGITINTKTTSTSSNRKSKASSTSSSSTNRASTATPSSSSSFAYAMSYMTSLSSNNNNNNNTPKTSNNHRRSSSSAWNQHQQPQQQQSSSIMSVLISLYDNSMNQFLLIIEKYSNNSNNNDHYNNKSSSRRKSNPSNNTNSTSLSASRSVRNILNGKPIYSEDLEQLLDRKLLTFCMFVLLLILSYFYFLFKAESMLHDLEQQKSILKEQQQQTYQLRSGGGGSTGNNNNNNNNMLRNSNNINNTNEIQNVNNNQLNNDGFLSKGSSTTSYIIFRNDLGGQGIGNILSGLLSTHILGIEFNRIVCLESNLMKDFLIAFEPIYNNYNVTYQQKCHDYFNYISSTNNNNIYDIPSNHIRLIDFGIPPNECKMKDFLNDYINHPIIYMSGNTYPRWTKVSKNFFHDYYKPKSILLNMLPYNVQNNTNINDIIFPKTVVHLRYPDNIHIDYRDGLDNNTLIALGDLLPSNTYLVTNQIAYYIYMSKIMNYQWQHPTWTNIIHSATGKSWSTVNNNGKDINVIDILFPGSSSNNNNDIERRNNDNNNIKRSYLNPLRYILGDGSKSEHINVYQTMSKDEYQRTKHIQNLQMWADWYTILQAKEVYHTMSDFSLSAVHWVDNRNTFTIQSYNNTLDKLILKREPWIMAGETISLIERIQPNETILMNELTHHKKKLHELEDEYPEYLRKCYAHIYQHAIEMKQKELGINIIIDKSNGINPAAASDAEQYSTDDAIGYITSFSKNQKTNIFTDDQIMNHME